MKFDRDDMEFSHPYFQRENPYLLEHIKRKISTAKTTTTDDKSLLKTEVVTKVLNEVKTVKGRQDSLDSRFVSMKQENEALWREVAILRQKHMKQQQIVNKLIQFLVTIVQPQRGSGIGSMGGMGGVKRRFQLMINDVPEASAKARKTARTSSASSATGPVIRELTEELLDYEDQDDDPNSPYVVSPGFINPTAKEMEEEIEEGVTDTAQPDYADDECSMIDDNGIDYDGDAGLTSTTDASTSMTDDVFDTVDPAINFVIESIDNLAPANQQAGGKQTTAVPQYQLRQQGSKAPAKLLPIRISKVMSAGDLSNVVQMPVASAGKQQKQIPLATVTSSGKSLLNSSKTGKLMGGKQQPVGLETAQKNMFVDNAETVNEVNASTSTSQQRKSYTNKSDFISAEIPSDLFGDTEQVRYRDGLG